MIWTTKNKYVFSRWFACYVDQSLARFYPASGVTTACLTRKQKFYNPISKLYIEIQQSNFPYTFKDNATQIRIYLHFKALSPEIVLTYILKEKHIFYLNHIL